MLIQDIKPRTGFSAIFERDIESRRIELAKHMGILKEIPVIYVHTYKYSQKELESIERRIHGKNADYYLHQAQVRGV